MPIDLQSRAEYLELALFSQNVVDALVKLIDQDEPEKSRKTLDDARRSLIDADSADPGVIAQTRAVFGSYEQLKTLLDVWTPEERRQATDSISEILNSFTGSAAGKESINELVSLFLRLEDQALWNFEQPRARVASRPLCLGVT